MADKASFTGGNDESKSSSVSSSGATTRTTTGVRDGETTVGARERERIRGRAERYARERQGASSPAETSRDGRKTRREKFDASRLPTPPPDPIPDGNIFDEAFRKHRAQLEAEALRKEGEFLDYLMGLPTPNESNFPTLSRSPSAFAVSLGAGDAFDHLDRLYILMEQVLTLREQNSKLSRRVRELEHLRALRSAHREVEQAVLTGEDPVLPEEDTGMAESLLGAMLSTGCDVSQKRNLRPPVPRQRSRSVGLEPLSLLHEINRPLNRLGSSKRRVSATNGAPKVSKWTKVKAAFKWERACTGGTNESEIRRYLKVPEINETSTAIGSSPNIVEISEPPTPGTLSSSSSTEDVLHGAAKSVSSNHSSLLSPQVEEDGRDGDPSRRSRSLDGDAFVGPIHSSHISKIGGCKPLIQVTSDRPTPLKASCARSEVVDLASRRLTPTLTITVPSNVESRNTSSPESVSPRSTLPLQEPMEDRTRGELEASRSNQDCTSLPPVYSHCGVARSKTCQDVSNFGEFKRQCSVRGESLRSSPKMQRHDSKWHKVKRAFLTNTTSVPPSPSRLTSFFNDVDGLDSYNASAEDLDNETTNQNIQAEIQRNYQILHDKLSVEFYRKLAEWEKLKNTPQAGSQQSATQDINLRSGSAPKERDSINSQLFGEGQLTSEFRKKLQEWNRMKKGHLSPTTIEPQAGRRRITDWQLWRSPSKPETKLETEHTKPHLSEDFIKKMEEWKRIKSGNFDDYQESSADKTPGGVVGQKDSLCTGSSKQGKTWKTQEEKEFQWLEKELNKIEREQQKLDRQREKFLDREARLSKLRRVVGSSPQKKEVLVQTSTGFYRFEGISRKFTRKLYEWEKSQGISPESSTFRLLNPAYRCPTGHPPANTSYERGPRQGLQRSKSVGSMVEGNTNSETPIRQPSSLSLNDMEELEAECMAAGSQISSEHTITGIAKEIAVALDDYEPEAMIVDIEDVVEETASPMVELQPHQTPIYCVAASETTSIAVPLGTVTASHEPSPVILVEAGEVHPMAVRNAAIEPIAVRNENLPSTYSASRDEREVVQTLQGESTCEQPKGSEWTTGGSQQPSSRQRSGDDYLTVLNKMLYNDKTLRQLDADISIIEGQLGDISEEEETAELLEDHQECDTAEMRITKRREINMKEGRKLKESFRFCLLQQVDLSRQLQKKIQQLQDIDSDSATRLLRLVQKLESVVTCCYNEVLQNLQKQEVQASVDNAEVTCPAEEDLRPANSVPHIQSAGELLSMISDAADVIFEPKEGRRVSDCSKDKPRMERCVDVLKTREKDVTSEGNVELKKKTKESLSSKPDCSREQLLSHEERKPCNSAKLTGVKRQTESRREGSIENENAVITVNKGNKQKKVLKTRRLTDTHVGYKCQTHGSKDSNEVPGGVLEDPTVRTVTLTTSAFRDTPNIKRIVINENTLDKIVVRTATNEPSRQSSKPETSSAHSSNRSSGNFSDAQDSPNKKEKNESRNVFVKTTRMIFSPFRRDGKGKTSGSNTGDIESDKRNHNDTLDTSNHPLKSDTLVGQPLWALHESRSNSGSPAPQRIKNNASECRGEVARRPPLPQSPILSRKEYNRASPKETAPSIRMMIQRYTQKLQEDAGSPASSGSGSPIWRSPASERRVRTKMERYQEEVRRAITGPFHCEVQKSASTSVIRDDFAKSSPSNSATNSPSQIRGIMKSSSVDSIKNTSPSKPSDAMMDGHSLRNPVNSRTEDALNVKKTLTDKLSPALIHKLTALSTAAARKEGRSILPSYSESSTSVPPITSDGVQPDQGSPPLSRLRALKIRRAKEDFLSRGPGCYSHDPQKDRRVDDDDMNRSDSRNSPVRIDLIKSASAGMINVDPDTFERLSLDRGCESLPRSSKRCSESSGRFSNIASKFRRARMRRGKDKDKDVKMSTVSMLCRQSLLVDIQGDGTSKSCPSTPALMRDDDDGPWIKNTVKTFK